jgi:hypothetical protein
MRYQFVLTATAVFLAAFLATWVGGVLALQRRMLPGISPS